MSIRYVTIDGERRSRLWWFRLWRFCHKSRCVECRSAKPLGAERVCPCGCGNPVGP